MNSGRSTSNNVPTSTPTMKKKKPMASPNPAAAAR
jgi:hypothetical protein